MFHIQCHEVIVIDATPKAVKRRGGQTKKAGERGWKTEPTRKKGIEMRDPDTGTDKSKEVLSPPGSEDIQVRTEEPLKASTR